MVSARQEQQMDPLPRSLGELSSKIISGRWDSIEIPAHLRFREPQVANPYVGVQSRYKSPPKKVLPPQAESHTMRRATSPLNSSYANVESRYRSPPKPAPSPSAYQKPEEKPIPKTQSIRITPEYAAIKNPSLMHVPSKFFDMYHMERQNSEPTPKDRVDQKIRAIKEQTVKQGRAFSPVTGSKSLTFEEIRKTNREDAAAEHPSVAKRYTKTHSVVMEWVRHGIPIPSSKPQEEVPKKCVSLGRDKPFFAPGGAGGGSYGRRALSPTRSALAAEERIVDSLKGRLTKPSEKIPMSKIEQLAKPRTPNVSPTRANMTASPIRNISPVRSVAGGAPPRTVSPSYSRPTQLSTARSPQRQTATSRVSVQSGAAVGPVRKVVTPRADGMTSRGPIDPLKRSSTADTSRGSSQQVHVDVAKEVEDIDVHFSVVSDLSDVSDAHPRIDHNVGLVTAAAQRQPIFLQGPPHLASP